MTATATTVTTQQNQEYWSALAAASTRSEIPSSITQTWTEQATKCFMTQADCNSCAIPRAKYDFMCQMKSVIPILLEKLGTPSRAEMDKLACALYD